MKLWCLYNIATGERADGLFLEEVRAFLMAIEDKKDWYLWTDRWSEWKPVLLLIDMLEPVERPVEGKRPPLPKSSRLPKTTGAKIAQDPPEIEIAKDSEYVVRSSERHNRRLKVVVECDGRKFATHSVDISTGGVKLEGPVPDWLVGYCKVQIINEITNEMVELTCSVVENQPPGQRVRLQFTGLRTAKAKKQFEKWLIAA